MADDIHDMPQDETPATVPGALDMPMRFVDFVATLRGTHDSLYIKVLKTAHKSRAHTLSQWRAHLEAVKNAALPETQHGYVVSPRGRRR